MCQKQIKLNAKEDVQEFVKAAGKCDFDIDVFYNRIIIETGSSPRPETGSLHPRAKNSAFS